MNENNFLWTSLINTRTRSLKGPDVLTILTLYINDALQELTLGHLDLDSYSDSGSWLLIILLFQG